MDTLIFEVGTALVAFALFSRKVKVLDYSVSYYTRYAGASCPRFRLIDLRFIESGEVISFLGRVGVIFLLFYLGLEFSIKN